MSPTKTNSTCFPSFAKARGKTKNKVMKVKGGLLGR
jgi:hypothetical protein